jgi:hypothetical protein
MIILAAFIYNDIKLFFHFGDDNSHCLKNSEDLTDEKSKIFRTFTWKILEVSGNYLIVYDNFGQE